MWVREVNITVHLIKAANVHCAPATRKNIVSVCWFQDLRSFIKNSVWQHIKISQHNEHVKHQNDIRIKILITTDYENIFDVSSNHNIWVNWTHWTKLQPIICLPGLLVKITNMFFKMYLICICFKWGSPFLFNVFLYNIFNCSCTS